jgi:hypothetical protein
MTRITLFPIQYGKQYCIIKHAGFEVQTAVVMKGFISWESEQYSPLEVMTFQWNIVLQSSESKKPSLIHSFTLKMEEKCSSET